METLKRKILEHGSNFNAAEFVANRKLKNGLTFLASYVYAKYLDIISYGAEGGTGLRDPENFSLNYGPSDQNVKHRFVASYIWQFPKAQQLNSVASAIVNGWSIQGIATLQTGSPYSINSNQDRAARAIGNDTADLVPGQLHLRLEQIETRIFQYGGLPGMLRRTLSASRGATS